jgi:nucleoside-diphosphate-sugar epimerase
MRATNALRVQGTANLLRAAIAAGAQRIVGESMIFAYGFGDHGSTPKTEADALQPREATAWLQPIVDAIRSLEDQLLAANAQGLIEAIPLRYGLIYGADPTTSNILRSLHQRRLPTISGTQGRLSWIHTSDAVEATLAALERGQPGHIYNIVDDAPVSLNDFLIAAARQLGAKQPMTIPRWLVRLLMPYVAAVAATCLPVSNQRAKHELHWQPQFPSYREGLRQVIREYGKQ